MGKSLKKDLPNFILIGFILLSFCKYSLADDSNDDLSLHVSIKQITGMSDASLNGTYITGEYGTDPERWTGRIKFIFDGNGNLTWQQIADSNGNTNSGSGTYSVAVDGTLSFIGRDGGGIVSGDGNTFVFVDADTGERHNMSHIPLLLLGN